MLFVQSGKVGAMTAAAILISASALWAQAPLDSLSTSQGKGFPWVAHTELEGYYLSAPGGNPAPYQISAYQAFTIQSLSFASFHLGLRSRETMAPGASQPYREPSDIKLAATIEVIRNFVYASIGGNIPLYAGAMGTTDTAALYQAMNDFSALPYPYFISTQALEAGIFGRYAFISWNTLLGVTYTRPGRVDILPGNAFFPAPFFNIAGRALLETGPGRHRWDLKATLYADETNDIRIPAHQEGSLYQVRYDYLVTRGKVGWQLGGGLAAKWPDANRKLKLKSVLEPTTADDNLQRAYGEFALAWAPSADILWRLHLVPQAVVTFNDRAGFVTEAGITMGLKVWDQHRIHVMGDVVYGQFDARVYTGFGARCEFSFRHLGIQDLEDAFAAGSEDG